MAVVRIQSGIQYLGLSTDDKPTAPQTGSTFLETNTGQRWIYDGTNWVEDLELIHALSQALR